MENTITMSNYKTKLKEIKGFAFDVDGVFTDGQVLVMQNMLGITQNFSPKFVRKYANIGETITNAVQAYISDVKDCSFPNEDEEY